MQWAPRKWIISLFATSGTFAFVQNSLEGIKACGINPDIIHVVFPNNAADELSGLIEQMGATPRLLEDVIGKTELGEMPSAYVEYGTPQFNHLMRARFPVIRSLAQECDEILHADIDVGWFSNPLPYLSKVMARYPMAFQTEASPQFPPNFCTGFFALRSGAESLNLIDAHIGQFDQDCSITMQALFNQIVENDPKYLLDIFPLPEGLFANGLLYSAVATKDDDIARLVTSLQPFIFHANFTIGEENKRKLLELAGCWRANVPSVSQNRDQDSIFFGDFIHSPEAATPAPSHSFHPAESARATLAAALNG